MTNVIKTIVGISFAVIVMLFTITLFLSTQFASASASPGLQATVATSSSVTLAAQTATAVIASSTCATRIITTAASGVMLLFTDTKGNTLTGSFGTALQAASTTTAYDSGQYGCGLVRAFSYGAQVITVSESN